MSQHEDATYTRTQDYASIPRYPAESSGNATLSYYFNRTRAMGEDDNDTVIVDNKLLRPSMHHFAEGDFIPPGFFNLAHLDGFTRRFKYSQWSYEMRRESQPILPFLSLGPSVCLRSREHLSSQGFTLLLAIRNTASAQARLVSGDKAAAELGILADTIDVLDNQELISAFPRAIRRINDHLAGLDLPASAAGGNSTNSSAEAAINKKVLVFCETGNERSAGMVIAYLMAMLNHDVISATRMVQQHRFCVSIEDSLKRILAAFESILAAKRDVESAKRSAVQTGATLLAPPPIPPILLAKKRSFHDCLYDDAAPDDNDMDMDEDDFLPDRKPVAPFQDRVA
ncbi:hypothetical protein N7466_011649 [Penicillium verhagenii]|uniref:uncharacterized protein n=1 Tax=Penicillium verhagenii TaxID=1562060 RepID=UPI002544D3B3|nr:uncharacterized protein N7466_011649 [Penicillium verhagenii]KAJ5915716.1 hypothetical protein N7466_011649 [Penicillium verhagenii]